jgi:hypothetical protein
MSILGLYDTLRARGPLQDIESAQPTSGQVYNDPSAVGPRQGVPDASGGLAEAAPAVDAGSRQTTQFLGKNYDQGLSDTQVDQARSKARVSTMRQYSLNDEANAQEKADADVGLAQAHTKYFNAEGAAREIAVKHSEVEHARTEAARGVNAEAGKRLQDLKDADGNPRAATPDELIGVARDRLTHLTALGLTEDADKAQTEYATLVQNKVTTEAVARNRAGASALAAMEQNDFKPAIDFYNQYVPDGSQVVDVKAGKKPGLLSVTVKQGDHTVTQDIQAGVFMDTAKRVIATASSASPQEALKFLTEEALKGAQTAAQVAAAAHSRAGAAKEGAETASITEKTSKTKEIDDALRAASPAYDKPVDQRTEADKLAIAKYERLQTLERARSGGGGADKAGQARTMNGKVNGQDVTIRTDAAGNPGEYLDRASPTNKSMVWKPIGRSDQVQIPQPGDIPPPAGARPPLGSFKR